MDRINARIAAELGVQGRAGGGRRRAARRGRDRAVHRALPQGEDRRARRHPVAHARDAARRAARSGGPARDGAQDHRGAGQADAGAGGPDQRRRHAHRAGRPLRALQAQAPHQGEIAREAGLEPLADALLPTPTLDPEAEAAKFIDAGKGVDDVKAALEGARSILIERIARGAAARRRPARDAVGRTASSCRRSSRARRPRARSSPTISISRSAIKELPSHRALALLRGRNEGILDLDLDVVREEGKAASRRRRASCSSFGIESRGPAGRQVAGGGRAARLEGAAAHLAVGRLLDARQGPGRRRGDLGVRQEPEGSAARRARRPQGDDGPRSRHPHRLQDRRRRCHRQGARHRRRSIRTSPSATGTARWPRLPRCRAKHKVELIAIGNGTASRETDKLVGELMKKMPQLGADQGDGVGGRRVGLFGLRAGGQGVPRPRRVACAARCRSRGACRIRWPSWSRSIRSRSASASTSTTSTRARWRSRSTPWSRTA